MIGIVLVTHGRFAVEFRAALRRGRPPSPDRYGHDRAERRQRTVSQGHHRGGQARRHGEGVAILTDMFGGTPSNLAISVMSRPKVEVLAGINLPMLVKLAKVRDDLAARPRRCAAQESGRKYITIASRVLAGEGTARRSGRRRSPRAAPAPLVRCCRSSTRGACTPAPPPSSCRRWSGSRPTSRVTRCGETWRHLDHGPDDARRRARQRITVEASARRRRKWHGRHRAAARRPVRRGGLAGAPLPAPLSPCHRE